MPFFKKQKQKGFSYYIFQNTNIKGNFAFSYKYNIIDIYGWNSGEKGGLLSLANSLNIPMYNKKALDFYKSKMHIALEKKPQVLFYKNQHTQQIIKGHF